MAPTYRRVKGSNLTADEVDDNFEDHEGRIANLEDNPPTAVGISNITVTGTLMTIYLADSTVLGPYTLPQAAFRPSVVDNIDGDTSGVYDPVLADRNGYLRYSGGAGLTVMLPGDDEVAFQVDDEISFRQAGAGVISFDAVTGVVINGWAGYLNQTAGIGSVITAKKVAANEWDLTGWPAQDIT